MLDPTDLVDGHFCLFYELDELVRLVPDLARHLRHRDLSAKQIRRQRSAALVRYMQDLRTGEIFKLSADEPAHPTLKALELVRFTGHLWSEIPANTGVLRSCALCPHRRPY